VQLANWLKTNGIVKVREQQRGPYVLEVTYKNLDGVTEMQVRIIHCSSVFITYIYSNICNIQCVKIPII
jgi:hypothetical protein